MHSISELIILTFERALMMELQNSNMEPQNPNVEPIDPQNQNEENIYPSLKRDENHQRHEQEEGEN